MQNRIHCHALDAHSYCTNTPRSASQINKTALGLVMEIAANKQNGISAFLPLPEKTDRGIHVGFVCDAETEQGAKVSAYVWARKNGKAQPDQLIQTLWS